MSYLKTMCPPGYHHNGFVATLALWCKVYGYTLLVSATKSSARLDIFVLSVKRKRSLIKRLKSNGPKIKPCETTLTTACQSM